MVIAGVVFFVAGVSFVSDLTGANYLAPSKHFNWVEFSWAVVALIVFTISAWRTKFWE